MGSYPQIADKRGTHDLYGPVNRMMCAGYDRAMVMFLTCVKVSACTACKIMASIIANCLPCRVPHAQQWNRSFDLGSHLHILTQYAFVGFAQVLLAQLGWMELKEHYYAPAGVFRLDHFTGQHL